MTQTILSNSPNLIRNSIGNGAVVGTVGSGGALPTNWSVTQGADALTIAVIGTGVDPTAGVWISIQFSGTSASNTTLVMPFDPGPTVAALSYTVSAYFALTAGALPAGGILIGYYGSPGGSGGNTTISSLTASFARSSLTATGILNDVAEPYLAFAVTTSAVISFTLRVGGVQFEQAAAATAWKPTPAWTFVPSSIVQLWDH